jgi:Cu/Ag efflux protein CusF
MNKKQCRRRAVMFATILCLLAAVAYGQQVYNQGKKVFVVDGWKKDFLLKGIIENVDVNTNWVTVTHENIPGWTNSTFNYSLTASKITMTYKVDNPEVLKTVKPGDRVTAKVFEVDFKVLYDLKVVPPEDTPVFFPKK